MDTDNASRTVLVVGTEVQKHETLDRFVAENGIELLQAGTHDEGLRRVREQRPALVLVEHAPPALDGLGWLKEAQQIDSSIEIVLIGPSGDVDLAIGALRTGALDFLRQPIETDQLEIALRRGLERMRRRAPGPPKLLVIEDHEPTRRRLVRILEKEGYDVAGAGDGAEGMRLFGERLFNLLVVDVRMPIKSGLQVLREVKALRPDVDVIVTTGHGDEEEVIQALRDGAANFLRKPIDIDHLLVAIERALDVQAMRRQLDSQSRDVELMQELVVRLTRRLELVVETPGDIGESAQEFLRQLVDSLPLGLIVATEDRKIVYCNGQVRDRLPSVPERVTPELLEQAGLPGLDSAALDATLSKIFSATVGTIEMLMASQWSFLLVTAVRRLRPQGSEQLAALVIRSERSSSGDGE